MGLFSRREGGSGTASPASASAAGAPSTRSPYPPPHSPNPASTGLSLEVPRPSNASSSSSSSSSCSSAVFSPDTGTGSGSSPCPSSALDPPASTTTITTQPAPGRAPLFASSRPKHPTSNNGNAIPVGPQDALANSTRDAGKAKGTGAGMSSIAAGIASTHASLSPWAGILAEHEVGQALPSKPSKRGRRKGKAKQQQHHKEAGAEVDKRRRRRKGNGSGKHGESTAEEDGEEEDGGPLHWNIGKQKLEKLSLGPGLGVGLDEESQHHHHHRSDEITLPHQASGTAPLGYSASREPAHGLGVSVPSRDVAETPLQKEHGRRPADAAKSAAAAGGGSGSEFARFSIANMLSLVERKISAEEEERERREREESTRNAIDYEAFNTPRPEFRPDFTTRQSFSGPSLSPSQSTPSTTGSTSSNRNASSSRRRHHLAAAGTSEDAEVLTQPLPRHPGPSSASEGLQGGEQGARHSTAESFASVSSAATLRDEVLGLLSYARRASESSMSDGSHNNNSNNASGRAGSALQAAKKKGKARASGGAVEDKAPGMAERQTQTHADAAGKPLDKGWEMGDARLYSREEVSPRSLPVPEVKAGLGLRHFGDEKLQSGRGDASGSKEKEKEKEKDRSKFSLFGRSKTHKEKKEKEKEKEKEKGREGSEERHRYKQAGLQVQVDKSPIPSPSLLSPRCGQEDGTVDMNEDDVATPKLLATSTFSSQSPSITPRGAPAASSAVHQNHVQYLHLSPSGAGAATASPPSRAGVGTLLPGRKLPTASPSQHVPAHGLNLDNNTNKHILRGQGEVMASSQALQRMQSQRDQDQQEQLLKREKKDESRAAHARKRSLSMPVIAPPSLVVPGQKIPPSPAAGRQEPATVPHRGVLYPNPRSIDAGKNGTTASQNIPTLQRSQASKVATVVHGPACNTMSSAASGCSSSSDEADGREGRVVRTGSDAAGERGSSRPQGTHQAQAGLSKPAPRVSSARTAAAHPTPARQLQETTAAATKPYPQYLAAPIPTTNVLPHSAPLPETRSISPTPDLKRSAASRNVSPVPGGVFAQAHAQVRAPTRGNVPSPVHTAISEAVNVMRRRTNSDDSALDPVLPLTPASAASSMYSAPMAEEMPMATAPQSVSNGQSLSPLPYALAVGNRSPLGPPPSSPLPRLPPPNAPLPELPSTSSTKNKAVSADDASAKSNIKQSESGLSVSSSRLPYRLASDASLASSASATVHLSNRVQIEMRRPARKASLGTPAGSSSRPATSDTVGSSDSRPSLSMSSSEEGADDDDDLENGSTDSHASTGTDRYRNIMRALSRGGSQNAIAEEDVHDEGYGFGSPNSDSRQDKRRHAGAQRTSPLISGTARSQKPAYDWATEDRLTQIYSDIVGDLAAED